MCCAKTPSTSERDPNLNVGRVFGVDRFPIAVKAAGSPHADAPEAGAARSEKVFFWGCQRHHQGFISNDSPM